MYEVLLGGRRCIPQLALVSADTLRSTLSLLVCNDLVSERDTGLCQASNKCKTSAVVQSQMQDPMGVSPLEATQTRPWSRGMIGDVRTLC